MQQQLVFCDEFGNTGADLFSVDQPVLVYAFVAMLPSSALLASELQGLYQSEGISLGELKSGQLLRSARGRARYKSIGKILTERRTHVLLSAVEKRYQVCSMIAETYLDPLLHELAPPEMRDRRFRQRFADGCYDLLEDARLIDFLAAVRSDDDAEIVALGKRLSATLRLHPDDFVSHAAERIEAIPEAVFRYCQKRAGLPRNSHIPASQYAGFYPGLQCVEGYLSRIGATAILVRDEDAQFGEALDAAVKWGKEVERLPGAADYGAIPLNHIASHRCASSTEDPGIQIADLAAGLFGRLAQSAIIGRRPRHGMEEIAEDWRGMLDANAEHYMMVSDAKLPEVSTAIFSRRYAPGN